MSASAQRVYKLLENESLWEACQRCHQLFAKHSISHAICGGVAVCLHGYQRNTTDVDFIIRSDDSLQIKQLLLDEGFQWNEQKKEFQSQSGVLIQFLVSGEKAGPCCEVEVPEPIGELNIEEIEGLAVVRLSRLIEMKLASGIGNLRRTHKDFADVVELIAIRKLDGSFARFLHPSLRETFRQLVRNATAP